MSADGAGDEMSEPKDTEHPEEHDGYGEPGDEYRQGCCFPDRCLMPGMHNRSECHDVEMMEAIHAEMAPDTEHASDHWSGAELAEHYTKPWAMVGRVQCVGLGRADEPLPGMGELIVRLPNDAPEVADERGVAVAIGGPWVPWPERGGYGEPGNGIYRNAEALMTPTQARELGQFLVEAADWADGGMTGPFEKVANPPTGDPVRWLSRKITAMLDDAVRICGCETNDVGFAADTLMTAVGMTWSLLRATCGQPETVEEDARKLGEDVQRMQAGKPWVVTAGAGMTIPTHPFTRLAEVPRYVFECDDEVWTMTAHGDICVYIAHEDHDDDEMALAEGWQVELVKAGGRWTICDDGAKRLAANTRDTTPAALESLLNLHGVPT